MKWRNYKRLRDKSRRERCFNEAASFTESCNAPQIFIARFRRAELSCSHFGLCTVDEWRDKQRFDNISSVHFLRHLWCSWNVYTIILQQKRSEQTESLWELLHNPQSLEPQSLIILRRTVNKRRQSDDDTIISSFIFALSVDIYHSHCFIHALLLMLACHTLVSISLSQAYNGMIKKLV